MNDLTLSAPVLGFVVGTRAALAFGMGLLLADRFPNAQRRTFGMMFLAIGAVTTIPAAFAVLGRQNHTRRLQHTS